MDQNNYSPFHKDVKKPMIENHQIPRDILKALREQTPDGREVGIVEKSDLAPRLLKTLEEDKEKIRQWDEQWEELFRRIHEQLELATKSTQEASNDIDDLYARLRSGPNAPGQFKVIKNIEARLTSVVTNLNSLLIGNIPVGQHIDQTEVTIEPEQVLIDWEAGVIMSGFVKKTSADGSIRVTIDGTTHHITEENFAWSDDKFMFADEFKVENYSTTEDAVIDINIKYLR